MKLYVNKTLISEDIKIANNFWEKLIGIIGTSKSILLTNTNSVHTFFLHQSINIYFLDKNAIVIEKYTDISPNRIIFPVKNATSVLEIYSTWQKSDKINIGDMIELTE